MMRICHSSPQPDFPPDLCMISNTALRLSVRPIRHLYAQSALHMLDTLCLADRIDVMIYHGGARLDVPSFKVRESLSSDLFPGPKNLIDIALAGQSLGRERGNPVVSLAALLHDYRDMPSLLYARLAHHSANSGL